MGVFKNKNKNKKKPHRLNTLNEQTFGLDFSLNKWLRKTSEHRFFLELFMTILHAHFPVSIIILINTD